MSEPTSAARKAFGAIARPRRLHRQRAVRRRGRPGLSPRDRSLVTVASLVSLYRVNELPFHLKKALDNGLTRDELVEAITHLAFYSGWPTASSAVTIAQRVFDEAGV